MAHDVDPDGTRVAPNHCVIAFPLINHERIDTGNK